MLFILDHGYGQIDTGLSCCHDDKLNTVEIPRDPLQMLKTITLMWPLSRGTIGDYIKTCYDQLTL